MGGPARRVVAAPGDRPADRQGEQPAEPRQLVPVGGAFLDRAVAVVGDEAFVLGERAGLLGEPSVSVGTLADDVVTGCKDVLGGGAAGGPGAGDLPPVIAALHGRSILAGL